MKKYLLLFGIIGLLVGSFSYASISTRYGLSGQNELQTYTFFSATTTTATSTNVSAPDQGFFKIVGAEKVTFYFSRGGATSANTGTSTFSVQVTPDGTNWHAWKLATTTAVNSAVDTVAIEAATSTIVSALDLEFASFYAVRCIVNETIDGEHTCSAQAEFK